MNAVYMLKERLEHATRWGKETLAGGQRNNKQFNDYIPVDKESADRETAKEKEEQALNTYYHPPDTVWTPRMLRMARTR
jgi:hypothetical protein